MEFLFSETEFLNSGSYMDYFNLRNRQLHQTYTTGNMFSNATCSVDQAIFKRLLEIIENTSSIHPNDINVEELRTEYDLLIKDAQHPEYVMKNYMEYIENVILVEDRLTSISENNLKLDEYIIELLEFVKKYNDANVESCCKEMYCMHSTFKKTLKLISLFYNVASNTVNLLAELTHNINNTEFIYKNNSKMVLDSFDPVPHLTTANIDPLTTYAEWVVYVNEIVKNYEQKLPHVHKDLLDDFLNSHRVKMVNAFTMTGAVTTITTTELINKAELIFDKLIKSGFIKDLVSKYNIFDSSSLYSFIVSHANFENFKVYYSTMTTLDDLDKDLLMVIGNSCMEGNVYGIQNAERLIYDLVRETLRIQENYYTYSSQLQYCRDTDTYALLLSNHTVNNYLLTDEEKIENIKNHNNVKFIGNNMIKHKERIATYIADYVLLTPYFLITCSLQSGLIRAGYVTSDQLYYYEVDDYCSQSSMFPKLSNWLDNFGNVNLFYMSSNTTYHLLRHLGTKFNVNPDKLQHILSKQGTSDDILTSRDLVLFSSKPRSLVFDSNNLLCKLMVDQYQTVFQLLEKQLAEQEGTYRYKPIRENNESNNGSVNGSVNGSARVRNSVPKAGPNSWFW